MKLYARLVKLQSIKQTRAEVLNLIILCKESRSVFGELFRVLRGGRCWVLATEELVMRQPGGGNYGSPKGEKHMIVFDWLKWDSPVGRRP